MSNRIPYKITNIEELQAAYPEVVSEETVIKKNVNKELLYKIVKLNHSLERSVPGVEIDAPPPTSET